MLQVPRQNLTSFTRTPLEVMMTCIVMLMIWKDGNCHVKISWKLWSQEILPLPLPSLFLRRMTGTFFTLRFWTFHVEAVTAYVMAVLDWNRTCWNIVVAINHILTNRNYGGAVEELEVTLKLLEVSYLTFHLISCHLIYHILSYHIISSNPSPIISNPSDYTPTSQRLAEI